MPTWTTPRKLMAYFCSIHQFLFLVKLLWEFRVRISVQNYARGKRSEIHNFGMPLIQNGSRYINYFHVKCLNEIKNEVGRLTIWHNDQLA